MLVEQELDDILAHYGIKGMRWGVRRTPEQLARARGERKAKRAEKKEATKAERTPSADAAKASEAAKKAKKSGVQTLSNEELQALNNRINLEVQYSKLTTKEKNTFAQELKKGKEMAKDVAELGDSVNDILTFALGPSGKGIAELLKNK